jgi:hypothetical protein
MPNYFLLGTGHTQVFYIYRPGLFVLFTEYYYDDLQKDTIGGAICKLHTKFTTGKSEGKTTNKT